MDNDELPQMGSDEQLTVELVLRSLTQSYNVWHDLGLFKSRIITDVAEIIRDVVHVEDFQNQGVSDENSLLLRQGYRLTRWQNAYLWLTVQYDMMRRNCEMLSKLYDNEVKLENKIKAIIEWVSERCPLRNDTTDDDECCTIPCPMYSEIDDSCVLIRLEKAIKEYEKGREKVFKPKKRTNFELMPEFGIEAK